MQKKELAKLMDFSMDVGERLLLSGGEIWRVDELLKRLFLTYGVERCDFFLLPRTILITAEDDAGETAARHRMLGNMVINMTEVSELDALLDDVFVSRPSVEVLQERFQAIPHRPHYPRYVTVAGMCIALSCLNYFIGGGLLGWPFILLGTVIGMGGPMLIEKYIDANHYFIAGICAFAAGAVIMACSFVGYDPYLILVITSISLVPGIPLINACRELLVGRALCGGLLFMTAALDTLSAAAGFWLAALAFGGAL